jgi:hypothetical protein
MTSNYSSQSIDCLDQTARTAPLSMMLQCTSDVSLDRRPATFVARPGAVLLPCSRSEPQNVYIALFDGLQSWLQTHLNAQVHSFFCSVDSPSKMVAPPKIRWGSSVSDDANYRAFMKQQVSEVAELYEYAEVYIRQVLLLLNYFQYLS